MKYKNTFGIGYENIVFRFKAFPIPVENRINNIFFFNLCGKRFDEFLLSRAQIQSEE